MRLLLIFILILSLSGCSLFRKTTVTVTETVTKVDTVIQVRLERDTMYVVKQITDTVKIESQAGTAVSYVDPINAKIVLAWLPKTFDVPIVINQTVKETVKEKKPMMKLTTKLLLLAAAWIIFMIGFAIYKLIIKR